MKLLPIPYSLPPRKSGFTLIETIIGVTIVALAAGLGALSLTNFRAGQQVDNSAQELTAFLQTAQGKSTGQEQSSRWGVYIDHPASGPSLFTLYQVNDILFNDPTYIGIPGTIIEQRRLSTANVFINPATGAKINIAFARATGLPSTVSTIVIRSTRNPNDQATVYVSANGRIEYQ